MNVNTKTFTNPDEFIRACTEATIRLVKLLEYAFVEPGSLGAGAFGMIGKERIVLTAFEKIENRILRWEKTQEAKNITNITVGTGGRGTSSGLGFKEEANKLRGLLEIEGIQVVDGEWTEQELEKWLAE
jgi:hypothetical protein